VTRAGAVVIGGDYRGLGIVRSLGRQGIPVWVAQGDDVLAGSSRYATRKLQWPETSEDDQIAFLVRLADEHQLQDWALFPTSDHTASLVSRNHALLATKYRLTTSPWPIYSAAQDKRLAYARAEEIGIGVPRTWYPESDAEVQTLDVSFPAILKPAGITALNAFTIAKAWRIDDRAALLARYAEARELVPPGCVLIQELIPGGGECQLSFAGVCRDGEVLASLTAQRTRQIPADFGRASTFVETIDRRDVHELAARLLAAIELSGLVEVEFKQDPRDGRLKLLDVNARVWGWHSVGEDAGVDFPYLAWRLAQGLEVPRVQGRAGVRWVRLSMDMAASFPEILARRTSLRTYVRTLRGHHSGPIAAADDRLPALAEIPILAWRTVRRTAARLKRSPPMSSTHADTPRGDAPTIEGGASMVSDPNVIIGYLPARGASHRLVIGSGARLRGGTVLYAGSEIGAHLDTGHNVTIREESKIGDDVSIWANSVIDYGCRIGDRVKIHSNCYVAQFSVIEDGAFLAPGVVLANDLYPGYAASAELMAGPRIEAGAQIGVNATVLPYVTIGAGAIIGAGSVVTRDVPPGAVAYGNPAVVSKTRSDLGDVDRRVRSRAARAASCRPDVPVTVGPQARCEAGASTEIQLIDPTTHPAWSELVEGSNSSVFSSPQWIDTIVATYGFNIEAAVLSGAGARPIAGLACADVRDLRGDRLISLPFSDYCDPIVDSAEHWDQLTAPFLARGLPLYLRVRDAEVPRNDERFDCIGELAWHGTTLEGDEGDVFARLDPRFRQALRAAERHGVTVRFGSDLDDVRSYYELHCNTRTRKYNLLPQPWFFFENMWKRFAPLDSIVVGLAEHDGDVIAGALYLVFGNVIYYKFGASIADRLRVRPNELLGWRSMLLGRERGCTAYDWGVSDLDQPGLITYKRKCATDERRLVVLRHTPAAYARPAYAAEVEETLTELTRALTSEDVPPLVAQRAGDVLYRFFAR
jgi:predicted ATP-grasp superfamily ATP-dependent carboligase/acetyltransferase-like isoleucine patch superfamily enzyme/CelD/BcsL family acetyltransferase involved in cellulose biosynthesis